MLLTGFFLLTSIINHQRLLKFNVQIPIVRDFFYTLISEFYPEPKNKNIMSTTQSLNTPATYLINNGSYDSNTIRFDLHLPKPHGFSYEFSDGYNISKNIGGSAGSINAICFFMKKSTDNGTPLSTTAGSILPFTLNTLIPHSGASSFNRLQEDAYLIVIHNDTFDNDLVSRCFNNLEEYIANVRAENSPKIIDINFVPRKLGVSIIKR